MLQGITRVNGKLIGYHYELGFIRRFDFSSKLKRMSAVVENAKLELLLVIFSSKKIKILCQPKTIPSNFNEVLNNYTSRV